MFQVIMTHSFWDPRICLTFLFLDERKTRGTLTEMSEVCVCAVHRSASCSMQVCSAYWHAVGKLIVAYLSDSTFAYI